MKKDFESIYSELCLNSADELRAVKDKMNKKNLTVLIICIAVNIIIAILDKQKIVLAGTIALSFVFFLVMMNKEFFEFRKKFKDLVVKKLVKEENEKLIYSPNEGVSKYDYTMSHFDDYFDEYSSEDLIQGILGRNSNFQMSQIVTREVRKEKDENGSEITEKNITFKGLFGVVRLENNSNTKIHIANESVLKKYNSKRIEMDSIEFEKQYDCLAEDKLVAMKIFTSDLIEKFALLKKENITKFEVKIENNMLYFRYNSGELFEPPRMKDVLDKKVIKKYFDTIHFPIELVEKIIENVNQL